MAHESFEDDEVADLMNQVFISIKVDREERPDIDNIYMAVCQAMTGHGGWPLTIIMTPDKMPFFSGTYIPKHNLHGRTGMMELTEKIQEIWRKDKNKLIESAEGITEAVKNHHTDSSGERLDEEVLHNGLMQLESIFDAQYGGFGSVPKFPTPHQLLFLLRQYKRNDKKKYLDMVLKTLDSMALGGIFDFVGFGFHRYSTDRKWLLPHFEKMLYDQAMLSMAYIEAYLITKEEKYKRTTEKVFEYVLRDMKSPEGALYSAEDADSEGEEGKFYVWSVDEIISILGEEDGSLALELFSFDREGNFKEEATGEKLGVNIIYLSKEPDSRENEKLENIRRKLYEEREKRVRPHRDDKILVDWNGLMIVSLSMGGAAFGNEKYIRAAEEAADFIIESIEKNKGLMHRFREGEWKVTANIDDYSFLIWGLLELYQATFKVKYLKKAIDLMKEQINIFWDENSGGFFFTSTREEEVLFRTKEVYDGAIPSGNSVSLLNLLKLGRITGETFFDEYGNKLQQAFSKTVGEVPIGYTQMLIGIDFSLGPTAEIVIAGDAENTTTKEMVAAIQRSYLPRKVLVFNPSNEENPEINDIAEYTRGQNEIDGKATAYVCTNFACSKPVFDASELLNRLQ
jgi:uncharacterized protein